VYQPGLLQDRQTIQQLLCENLYELCAQSFELILLDQFVEIRRKALKHQTKMALVNEVFLHPEDVVLVSGVVRRIELYVSHGPIEQAQLGTEINLPDRESPPPFCSDSDTPVCS
jgi:hypothetical protein